MTYIVNDQFNGLLFFSFSPFLQLRLHTLFSSVPPSLTFYGSSEGV